jgi:methylenetetrahydrofolate dehydrogenase (NADP+)/methenyltetrahydrofolate cyclohydrolase/formyltetrahydrofolate synthetase
MPTAKIIDGKAMAQAIRAELKKEVDELRARHPYFEPHLAVVQVGGREDSSLYIRQKERAAQEASDDRVVTCTEMTHHLL